jgi:hypothetical protein
VRCAPCTAKHRSAGLCYDGESCASIKHAKPTSKSGVYMIRITHLDKPFAMHCDVSAFCHFSVVNSGPSRFIPSRLLVFGCEI